jgi:hypothetical protein
MAAFGGIWTRDHCLTKQNPDGFLRTSQNAIAEFEEFAKWFRTKYSISYGRTTLCYAEKYSYLLEFHANLRIVELLSN